MSAQKLFFYGSFLAMLGAAATSQASTGAVQPLTAQQKSDALSAFQSASLGSAVVNTQNPDMVAGEAPGQDPLSQKFIQMASLLQNAVQTGTCIVASQHSTDQHGMVIAQSFKISGATCLVNYDLESASPPNVDGTSSSKYTSNNPSYSALNDIDFMQMDTTTHLTGGPGGALILTDQGKGYTHSQLLGDLALPITENGTGHFIPGQSTSVEVTMDVQFPSFMAELQVESQSNASGTVVNYILNGELLTTDEIMTYINLPFAPHPRNGAARAFGQLF